MIVATKALEAEREAREAAAAERVRYGGMWSDDEAPEPADSHAGNDKRSQPVSRPTAADVQHHDSLTFNPKTLSLAVLSISMPPLFLNSWCMPGCMWQCSHGRESTAAVR